MKFRLIESKEDRQRFEDKFGEGSYLKFTTNLPKINKILEEINNGNLNISLGEIQGPLTSDITWVAKHVSKEVLLKLFTLLDNYDTYFDMNGNVIEVPYAKDVKLIATNGDEKLYHVKSVSGMIKLSDGTGKGDIGGSATGWCVGGRYSDPQHNKIIPYGKVDKEQARKYFWGIMDETNSDYYYVLITPETKYCIMADKQRKIINVTDSDDNDHYYDRSIGPNSPKNAYLIEFYNKYHDILTKAKFILGPMGWDVSSAT